MNDVTASAVQACSAFVAAGSAVRPAQPADAPLVSALLRESNGEPLLPDELRRRLQQFGDWVTAFLGEVAGEIGGLLVLRTVPTLSDAEGWAEITEMYVQPAFRGQGLGRALVGAAMEHCRRRGCREVHLLVDPLNEAVQSFYERMGFRRDSWEMRHSL